MRVLFVSINKLKSYRPVLPIGMITVATQVRDAGHEVQCLDLMFEEDDESVVRQAVTEFGPDLVGISIRNVDSLNLLEPAVYTPIALEIAEWARDERPQVRILLGGAGFTTVPEDLMDFVQADYGLTGFAEESMVSLLRALETNEQPTNVPGVIYPAAEGGYHRTQTAFEIDYSAVKRPDRALYDPRYFEYTFETHDGIERVPATIQTKKGCVLECVFCSNFLVDGTGVKFSPAAQVVDEIERLRDEGVAGMEIVDGVFNLPIHYSMQVLTEMKRRGVILPWSCMINPGAVTPQLVELMRETGCEHVEFGTDSCNDRVLRTLKKNFRQRQVIDSHRRFTDAGIKVMHCLFIGSPGDDAASVRETFDVISMLVPPGSRTARAYWTFGLRICRGTDLHRTAVAEGLVRQEERFLVPKYYVSRPVISDDDLLDDIQNRVLGNANWYLWWGLSHISLKERIRLAHGEHARIEHMLLTHLSRPDRRRAATMVVGP
ncbi:MAG: B12-binding domain-containing radical SAM protein [Pseudonocardiaceae bacterium]